MVQRARLNCADCTWAFYSIYGSSHVGTSYLASFAMRSDDAYHAPVRKFQRLVTDEEIFHGRGYSWGNRDRLYQAENGRVKVCSFLPDWGKTPASTPAGGLSLGDGILEPLEDIQLAAWKGAIVSGAVALFGVVVECENAIVVAQSDGTVTTLPDEPVNWRVFPRSKHYENQLHVVYSDHLEIYSFNQDYFVDQRRKRAGFTFQPRKRPNRPYLTESILVRVGDGETGDRREVSLHSENLQSL